MISFSQFITEARLAPLYHGTTLMRLDSILTNGIAPTTLQYNKSLMLNKSNIKDRDAWLNSIPSDKMNDYKKFGNGLTAQYTAGVSLSRSMNFAMYHNRHDAPSGRFVIEVDQEKLTHRFRIIPIQYFQILGAARKADFGGVANEYEEFVITTKPIDPRYFKAIHYSMLGTSSAARLEFIAIKKKHPNIEFKEMK